MQRTVVTIDVEVTFTTTPRSGIWISDKEQFLRSGKGTANPTAIKEHGVMPHQINWKEATTAPEAMTTTGGEAICAHEATPNTLLAGLEET